jgi:acetyl esterase/lipase
MGGRAARRLYVPERADAGRNPLVVYYHGGGWVIADLDA